VSTLARTCLRDAHVVPGGRPLAAAVAALDRARHRLAAERGPLQHVVLGATVVGDGAGAPPGYRDAVVAELARLTGRPLLPHPAPASALQHPDDVLAVSTAAARLAATLAKLAGDLRFLAAGPIGGPAELDLPVVLEGSTFYAGKRNPVVPESVIAVAAEVAGHHAAAEQLAGRAELDLNVFDGPAALHAADALDLTTRAAHHLRRHAIAELSVAEDRCAALVRRHLRSLEEPQP
jgi:aspartate ammonia-lyase